MSEFRRRLLVKNANKGGIKLPTYDKATYPYTALLKGTFISGIANSTGISSGYAFCLSNLTISRFKYNVAGYLWGSRTNAHGIVYASSDGITWQSIYEGDNYVKTGLSTIEETIYDTITST